MRRIASAVALLVLVFSVAGPAEGVSRRRRTRLFPGTAVLLNQSGGGDGGNGGNAKTTSSATNIFSPAAYVDYKRFGGEPTVAIDRYPFAPGQFDCPATATAPCPPKDIAYQSAPNGFPTYSQFWKSDDLAATFRKPKQVPVHGLATAQAGGGGDSHQVVGHVTHRVYFTDLPLYCEHVNVSRDLGETFTPDNLGCGLNPGLDDRQWLEEDETAPTASPPCPPGASPTMNCGSIYLSFINFVNLVSPTLSLARSEQGAAFGTFAASPCNSLTMSTPPASADDDVPTACPDPSDDRLQVAGPVVADKFGMPGRLPTHNLFIPFVRGTPVLPALLSGPPYELYIAKSTDGGDSWTRHKVAELDKHNPINIFPQLTIDRGGNLYYTWSQTQGPDEASSGFLGEQDVHYTFSRDGGATWASPINLTKEKNDTAVFPWMIAGDPGRVNLVMYKANTGINSNIGFFDAEGPCEQWSITNPTPENPCDEDARPNPSVWNVYFSQSLNALNSAPNFKAVQVSAAPNHLGQVCTLGLACEGDRSLLDFFTVDVDHRGAAHIAYSDDMNGPALSIISRDRTTRQIAGTGVFKNQTITLQNSWPVRNHSAFDRAGDVYDPAGFAKDSCPGMDVLKTTADRNGSQVTITLTLNGAPTAAKATACGGEIVDGGVWGAEFWARSSVEPPAHNFYIAYRDDTTGGPRVEGGVMDNFNPTVTSLEFASRTAGTLGGTCFPSGTGGPQATGTCTIAMTVDVTPLGISPGNALLSLTGLSAYFTGIPDFVLLGNTEQADAAAAFHMLGSGTT
jgi:hypothetical protein